MSTPADLLYRMALATDTLDIPLMESLFHPTLPIHIDVSKHLGFPPMDILPDQAAANMIAAISGFSATHHVITNPVAEQIDVSRVNLKAYKTAYHCIQAEEGGEIQYATARGTWEMEVEKVDGRWVVRTFVVVRTVPLTESELGLWEVARGRVEEGKGRVAEQRS